MPANLLVTKSRAFALRIVQLYKYLQGKKELVLSKQMLRSGTSIGANIAEELSTVFFHGISRLPIMGARKVRSIQSVAPANVIKY